MARYRPPQCVETGGLDSERACSCVGRAASTMAPIDGRWPPGKMCSRMKSLDAQYSSYRSSGSVITWGSDQQQGLRSTVQGVIDGFAAEHTVP